MMATYGDLRRALESGMKHEREGTFRREPPPIVREGNLCSRALLVNTRASLHRCSAVEIAAKLFPNDRSLMQLVTRATSNPAMTSVLGWAAELVHKIVADTLEVMGAASGAADVMKACFTLAWDGAGIISVPAFVASANFAGFVQEGQPIPVYQLSEAPIQLQPHKVATIATLTREMVEGSNAESIISDALSRSTGLALDAVFFGSAAATAAAPAGILNGVAPLTASTNTDSYGGFAEDVSALINAVSAVGGKGPYLFIGSPGRITTMRMHYATGENPIDYDVIMSNAVGNNLVVIAPKALSAVIDANPTIETSNAATLVMDTAPGTPGQTGYSEKEMWQTDSLAIKVRWPVTWAVRNLAAVAYLTPLWK
jgi:hypothetical protein